MLEPTRQHDFGKAGPKAGHARPKINAAYHNARKFLEYKLDEIIATNAIPALGAVLVLDDGKMIISAARGTRRLGTVGESAKIRPDDKWLLASISKPITGTAIAAMIDKGIGGIGWKTTLDDVMPHIFDEQPASYKAYKKVTIELLMAHSAGFGYNPANEPSNMWIEAPTPAYLNDFMVRARRFLFTRAYVLDKPLYPPGKPGDYEGESRDRYGGGPIVCASLYEQRTAERFEYLVGKHVFEPLGMTQSTWGRTDVGPGGGMWQHLWNAETSRLEPDPEPQEEAQAYHSHMPAGGYCVSAEDFGKFLAEFLVDNPRTMSESTRDYVLANKPATGQNYLSSGWSGKDANAVRHSGELRYLYTTSKVFLDDRWALGVFSNAAAIVTKPAVGDAINTLATLRERWEDIVGDEGRLIPYHPCVHPIPGIVARSSGVAWLVGRKPDGSLRRQKMATGVGGSWPGMVATSGVACAASADGETLHVAVRGSDNNIWNSRSRDGGQTWSEFAVLPAKSCRSGPALACSSDGSWLYAAALDPTGKIVFAASPDHGRNWSAWNKIGGHACTSQPGLACSDDGQVIHVVARGVTRNILYNVSRARGSDWDDEWRDWSGLWQFSSGAAVICDGDGDRVQIAARTLDRRIMRTRIPEDGLPLEIYVAVDPDWEATSSPVFARKGQTLVLAAYGEDYLPYASVGNFDGEWGDWNPVGATRYI